MAGGPQRCEKHNMIHCKTCWLAAENSKPAPAAGLPSDSVRARLTPEVKAPAVVPRQVVAGTFDPPGDIEGFGVEPTPYAPAVITGKVASSVAAVAATQIMKNNDVDFFENESPEVAEFVAASRRYAVAKGNLKSLIAALKAAKIEQKAASAEFKKIMHGERVVRVPRVKKTRKARTSLSEDSKPE